MKVKLFFGILILMTSCFFSCDKKEEIDVNTGLYDIYIFDFDKTTNSRITNTPQKLEYPFSFSSDSKSVLFRTDEGVFTVNVDGSDVRLLISLTENPDLELSGDGKEFIYAKDGNLWLMNFDGTEQRKLTNSVVNLWKPIWSPDGQNIACSSDSGIAIVNINGNTELISKKRPVSWYDWSPDSKKLTYSKYVDNKYSQIFVFDFATKKEKQLTSFQKYSHNPVWRPDSEEIIFTSSIADYGSDLILMNADGSVQKTIFHQIYIGPPVWSPDGNHIAFINENTDLSIIDSDGNNYKVLNNIPGACLQPIWSPDGNYILYYRAIFFD